MKLVIFLILSVMWPNLSSEHSSTVWKPLDEIIITLRNNTDELNRFVTEQQAKAANSFKHYYENMANISKTLLMKTENNVEKDQHSINTAIPKLAFDKFNNLTGKDSPLIKMDVSGAISAFGYRSEAHSIITKDGYILSIHRIPHSPKRKASSPKSVLLQHGIFGSSADWTMAGPQKSLAYILSDAGYDVWMANSRGNTYSRQHVFLKPDSSEFWNFTWHEAALNDLPAVIDYIRGYKGNNDLRYIGHSMGTTLFTVLLSCMPEYNQKLKMAIFLSPVVYMSDIKGPLSYLKTNSSPDNLFSNLFDSYELKPATIFMKILSQTSCDVNTIDKLFCQNAMFSFAGFNDDQMDADLLPIISAHSPAGVSSKTLIHYAQEISSGGKFQMFDYGEEANQSTYGSKQPPEYDLSKITLPIALFWSKNDWISGKYDVENLYSKLRHPIQLYTVPNDHFNHIDFLWAKDAPEIVYNKVLEVLSKY